MVDWTAYPISLGELQKHVTRVHPGAAWADKWKRCKLVGRGLLYGPWNVSWQEYLRSPFMGTLTDALPQIVLKVQLPYLNRRYGASKRLEILRNHYDFAQDRLSGKLLHRLVLGESVLLARWGTSVGDFSLSLDLPKRFWQEGELELALRHEATGRLFAFLHFTVSAPGEISIGCMQGGKPVDDPTQMSHQQLSSAFRRDMHGLRHKPFLLYVLRHIAHCWNITSLRAISTDCQIWAEKVMADYDAFWLEEGGVRASDGMFNMPLELASKGSRTKAMYQRRDQCLDLIGREVMQSLQEPWRNIESIDVSLGKGKSKPNAEPAQS